MFEVGFSELCMLGVVALLVIGPEKLPKVARLAGFWLGKTRAMLASVKAEIKEELRAEEMRQLFNEQQNQLNEFQEMLNDAADPADAIKSTLRPTVEEPITHGQPHEPK